METINDLINKTKLQRKVIDDLMIKENNETETRRYLCVRRFLTGFINDLSKIKTNYYLYVLSKNNRLDNNIKRRKCKNSNTCGILQELGSCLIECGGYTIVNKKYNKLK